MRKIIVVLVFFSFLSGASAQENTYNTAIGLRLGIDPGLSIKTFIAPTKALEGLVDLYTHGILLTGLYEIHKQAFNVERLSWFYGLGGHIGSFRGGYYTNWDNVYYADNFITLGIDGILGLEYHMKEIPFTVGVDIKPFVDIVNPGIGYLDGALTLRYAF